MWSHCYITSFHWRRHLGIWWHWCMIMATFWRHHWTTHICTCTIHWRWLTTICRTRSRITWWYNTLTFCIAWHRKPRISRRRHHFSCHIVTITTCVSKALPHIRHGIHDRSWHFRPFRHHHCAGILHHCAHFWTTSICWPHMHSTTDCWTERITCSVECFWGHTHICHHWAHNIAHSLERGTHISAVGHRSLKSLHSLTQSFSKSTWICTHCIHYFLRHLRHWIRKHHSSSLYLRVYKNLFITNLPILLNISPLNTIYESKTILLMKSFLSRSQHSENIDNLVVDTVSYLTIYRDSQKSQPFI